MAGQPWACSSPGDGGRGAVSSLPRWGVDTLGSVTDERQALGFLAVVNANRGWACDVMLGGRAAVPVEALRRRHAHAVNKAPGLPADVVRLVLSRYVLARVELPWDLQ